MKNHFKTHLEKDNNDNYNHYDIYNNPLLINPILKNLNGLKVDENATVSSSSILNDDKTPINVNNIPTCSKYIFKFQHLSIRLVNKNQKMS